MEVGKVKIAEDSDFDMLKRLIDHDSGWKLDYDKSNVKVSKNLFCLKSAVQIWYAQNYVRNRIFEINHVIADWRSSIARKQKFIDTKIAFIFKTYVLTKSLFVTLKIISRFIYSCR